MTETYHGLHAIAPDKSACGRVLNADDLRRARLIKNNAKYVKCAPCLRALALIGGKTE